MSDATIGFSSDTAIGFSAAGHVPGSKAATSTVTSVLHVFNYFKPDFTGDGLYFEKLFPRLEREGVTNEVIVGRTSLAPGAAKQTGVRLFGRFGSRHFNPVMLLWFLVNAWRFDVVHFHCAVDRLFAYHLVAWISGCRIMQSSTLDDGLGSLVEGYKPRYRWLVRILCRLIDDFVAISPNLLADTQRAALNQRIHLIPQGVALPVMDGSMPRAAFRHGLGVAPDDTLLLFVGSLIARKDARFLVDNHPLDAGAIHLLLVGPELDVEYVAALRAAIAETGFSERFHVHGYMDNPGPAYGAADAFVFASHQEGCPNVVLEAMAHGLPVIARRLCGTTDSLVQNGCTGILFDTSVEYVNAVRLLAAAPETRMSMGAAALASIRASYEMNGVARRYAGLYHAA